MEQRPLAYPVITVKNGRDKPLRQRHPWVFSGAIHKADAFGSGDFVEIRDGQGKFLAYGYGNANSQIRARALSFDVNDKLDAAFFRARLAAAAKRRAPLLATPGQTAARLVMSEADQLPGLIVDRYGEWLVVQALTAGIDRQKELIFDALQDLIKPRGIIERSDDHARDLEGLAKTLGLVRGEAPPPAGVEILENGLRYLVDPMEGHKTGFYLDQRENHAYARSIAAGRRVLDCFSYTGGFTLSAAAGGAASVLSVDASAPALTRLGANLAANDLGGKDIFTQRVGNVFEVLRELKEQNATFDLIVLDPPKFAATGAQVEKAARGYKDINLLAFKMLAPGGILLTYSCSGHISADLFQKIIFGAAIDAGRDAQIIHHQFQADDHPVLLTFPESLYLKGLACRVV